MVSKFTSSFFKPFSVYFRIFQKKSIFLFFDWSMTKLSHFNLVKLTLNVQCCKLSRILKEFLSRKWNSCFYPLQCTTMWSYSLRVPSKKCRSVNFCLRKNKLPFIFHYLCLISIVCSTWFQFAYLHLRPNRSSPSFFLKQKEEEWNELFSICAHAMKTPFESSASNCILHTRAYKHTFAHSRTLSPNAIRMSRTDVVIYNRMKWSEPVPHWLWLKLACA